MTQLSSCENRLANGGTNGDVGFRCFLRPLAYFNFVSVLTPQGQTGSIVLPQLNVGLDPHWPRTGPELVFVSHAHSDHVAAHREVILSAPTSRLMQARLPGKRLEHVLPFGEARTFGAFEIRLLPAGHIFGSAMAC